MFDGLLKPKFYTKCKSTIKIMRIRLYAVKSKKKSVCKYFKNDIADLLRSSHDYNAYGRIEGYLEEKKRLSCYEHLEQFCASVLNNLSLMVKQRECPEECREAVSSLIFAAARVSEIPELRDLRSVFTERYGNAIDAYVNHEFSATFESQPPLRDIKIRILREIAQELSIRWDSKNLEQKLSRQNSDLQTAPRHQSSTTNDEKCDKRNGFGNSETKLTMKDIAVAIGIDKNQKFNNIYMQNVELQNRKKDEKMENPKLGEIKDLADSKKNNKKSTNKDSLWASSSSSDRSMSEEDEVNLSKISKESHSYRSVPPPYTKSQVEKNGNDGKKPNNVVAEETGVKPKPKSVRQRFLKPQVSQQ